MSLFTGMSDTAVGERGDLREEGDGEAGHVVSSGHDGDDTGGGEDSQFSRSSRTSHSQHW